MLTQKQTIELRRQQKISVIMTRGGSGMGYPIPRKKIPIPGYGNPGDFELKSWDPHPGIFENIPDFRKYIPKFSEKFFLHSKNKKKQ